MLLTRNWLNKQINLGQTSNEKISVALNSLGFEVEHEINYKELNKNLIIGYVQECLIIPNTHLSVNQVKISKTKTIQIVCGAPNVMTGQYVLVAPLGATIADGTVMTKRTIQGYESNGMICSLSELGFTNSQLTSDEQKEIYVVKDEPNLNSLVGHSINELGFDDYVWDVDLTLNRSDALSAVQLAKELANYFNVSFKKKKPLKIKEIPTSQEHISFKMSPILAKSVNTLGYSYFSLAENPVHLYSSDDIWLKMNNVKTTGTNLYDLANKAILETGQPVILVNGDKTHDLELKREKNDNGDDIIVLKQNADLVAVIGQEVTQEFRVNEYSTKVLAIYLNFDPAIMRKQQKILNQSSPSLQRWMKPIYSNKFEEANEALARILNDNKSLKLLGKTHYEIGPVKTKTEFDTSLTYINKMLGMDLTAKKIKSLFKYLDFEVIVDEDKMKFKIDPNRIDIYGPLDLVEEVARLYGYDKIPTVPMKFVPNVVKNNLKLDLEQKTINYLIGQGMTNIKTYSLINSEENKHWNLFNLKQPIKVLSPLSKNHEQYRLNLSSSMVQTVITNVLNSHHNFVLFEVADVYFQKEKAERHLSIGMTGKFDYYDLKAHVDAILRLYNIDPLVVEYNLKSEVIDEIHPYINAEILVSRKRLGFIYKLNPRFEAKNKITDTFVAEINLDLLYKMANLRIENHEFSKYQDSSRDLSIELPLELPYQEVLRALVKDVKNLIDYELTDTYQDQMMRAKKVQAVSVSFTFNNLKQQMTDEQITKSWEQILKNAKELGLKVR